MGKFNQGIHGPYSGKVGPVVGSSWMGLAVVRSRPPKRKKGSFTPGELAQQMKFKLMSEFLSPVMWLLNITFKNLAVRMTGFNKGYSYNVKNAFAGIYPDLKIDYSMVLLSRGDLPNPGLPSVNAINADRLVFTWENNTGRGKALETDKVFGAIYCEETRLWNYKLDLAMRKTGSCEFDVSTFGGKYVHVYLGFISENNKEVSDSTYLGLVELL